MANVLTPDYLDIDYNTLIASIKSELQTNATFRDYNYEGSNIAILIELVSYIGELNTYYLNRIAKNTYIETADIYENVNRLARQEGYEPKGYISSKTTMDVTVSGGYVDGDILYIPAWHKIASDKQTDAGDAINFATTKSQTFTASSAEEEVEVEVSIVQGDVIGPLSYTGEDIIDNEIILPTYNYAFDDDIDDSIDTIELTVNGTTWDRISDFYDELSALSLAIDEAATNNVYMMRFDKYKRSKIVFSSSRSVPGVNDEIEITLLKSLGVDGNVAAVLINSTNEWTPDSNFIKNTTDTSRGPDADGWLANSTMTFITSVASIGGANAEDIDDLRDAAKGIHNAQYRNVAANDYKTYLESRSDVGAARIWGEQEIAPSGSILEYNKVHISVLPDGSPDEWETGTLNASANTWVPTGNVVSASASIYVPTSYASVWTSELEEYLEPRKMLNAYETWDVPELVYFSMTMGVRLYRLYTFADVSTDIRNKLIWYFRQSNRNFYDLINFMDIQEYLLDTTVISDTDDFDYIKGIRNLMIRDIDCSESIYETNTDGNYPQFTTSSYAADVENILRPIRLGYEQFPILASSVVSIVQET